MVKVTADEDKDVSMNGLVCGTCLQGGPSHMIRELRNRAEDHQRFAQQYDAWADGVLEALQKACGLAAWWAVHWWARRPEEPDVRPTSPVL